MSLFREGSENECVGHTRGAVVVETSGTRHVVCIPVVKLYTPTELLQSNANRSFLSANATIEGNECSETKLAANFAGNISKIATSVVTSRWKTTQRRTP
jgi:hypothetical protein